MRRPLPFPLRLGVLVAPLLLSLGACSPQPAPAAGEKPAAKGPGAPENTVKAAGPRLVPFPGEQAKAAVFVADTMKAAPERQVLVYVGATWCEPCQRFHDAVEAGELDATFPDLELVEFDLDEHRDSLTEAGYGSRLVPLFSVPGADGRDQEVRIEGSIKGEAAVQENLVPRLEALLARSR